MGEKGTQRLRDLETKRQNRLRERKGEWEKRGLRDEETKRRGE